MYRVADYATTVGQLRERGVTVHELEIPHGPCGSFTAEGGQRYAVYQLVRPEASTAAQALTSQAPPV